MSEIDFRYERKFLTEDLSRQELGNEIRTHPADFYEIFKERIVNNIYFDSFGFSSFYDNIDGNFSREKYRIRWYGETFGFIEKPVLERKIKQGVMGTKLSYGLNPFNLNKDFQREIILNSIDRRDIPKNVKDNLSNLMPVLLNSYKRKYFLSRDKKFRLTLDSGLTFYQIRYSSDNRFKKFEDYQKQIIELKYAQADDIAAKEIGNFFSIRLTKSSKYVMGIESVLF